MPTGNEHVALLVGGDAPTRAMLRFLLKDNGCEVIEVATVGAIASVPADIDVALVVLVAGEREEEVLASLVQLRLLSHRPPILLLTHGAGRDLRRRAFAYGVEDVVGLPASAHDLRERLRVVLGQDEQTCDPCADVDIVRAGGLTLRSTAREVSDGAGRVVRLTRREVALLRVVMLAPGRVVGYHELLERVWGAGGAGHSNALAALVRQVRAKLRALGAAHGYVRTVHGHGYAFEARAVPRLPGPPASPRPRVLVVDDDPAARALLAEVLHRAGYAVTCGAGAQAPALARTLGPTLILLDLRMPDLDGVAVRRQLQAHPRTAAIPVIACSAGPTLRAQGAALTADDYLAKPFDLDELLLRVEKWAGPPHWVASTNQSYVEERCEAD